MAIYQAQPTINRIYNFLKKIPFIIITSFKKKNFNVLSCKNSKPFELKNTYKDSVNGETYYAHGSQTSTSLRC